MPTEAADAGKAAGTIPAGKPPGKGRTRMGARRLPKPPAAGAAIGLGSRIIRVCDRRDHAGPSLSAFPYADAEWACPRCGRPGKLVDCYEAAIGGEGTIFIPKSIRGFPMSTLRRAYFVSSEGAASRAEAACYGDDELCARIGGRPFVFVHGEYREDAKDGFPRWDWTVPPLIFPSAEGRRPGPDGDEDG